MMTIVLSRHNWRLILDALCTELKARRPLSLDDPLARPEYVALYESLANAHRAGPFLLFEGDPIAIRGLMATMIRQDLVKTSALRTALMALEASLSVCDPSQHGV